MATYNPDPIDVSACCNLCESSSSSSSEPAPSSSSSSSSSDAPFGSCGFRFEATVDCEADPPTWTVNPTPVKACLVPGVIYDTWMSDPEGQNLDSSEEDSCTRYYFIAVGGDCDILDECPDWGDYANSSSEAIVPDPPETEVPEDCCVECCTPNPSAGGTVCAEAYILGSTKMSYFEYIFESSSYDSANCSGSPSSHDGIRIVFDDAVDPLNMTIGVDTDLCGVWQDIVFSDSTPVGQHRPLSDITVYTRSAPGDPWTEISVSEVTVGIRAPENADPEWDINFGVDGSFYTDAPSMACCDGGEAEEDDCEDFSDPEFEFSERTRKYLKVTLLNACATDVCGSSSSEPEVEF